MAGGASVLSALFFGKFLVNLCGTESVDGNYFGSTPKVVEMV